MLDERFARLRTHRNNIARYRRLLKTKLTDLERQFIERRLSEEQSEFELLSAGNLPPSQRRDRDLTAPDARLGPIGTVGRETSLLPTSDPPPSLPRGP
jgi:hypothetical protein